MMLLHLRDTIKTPFPPLRMSPWKHEPLEATEPFMRMNLTGRGPKLLVYKTSLMICKSPRCGDRRSNVERNTRHENGTKCVNPETELPLASFRDPSIDNRLWNSCSAWETCRLSRGPTLRAHVLILETVAVSGCVVCGWHRV
jgi:hypothetical protein